MRRYGPAAFLGLAISAGPVSAAFLGIEMREDKDLDPAAVAVADPEGVGLRVFNIYAKFDQQVVPDTSDPASENTVLSVGQPDSVSRVQLLQSKRPGSIQPTFYQNTAFGGNLPPNAALFPIFPELELDTYVGLGNKVLPAPPDTDTTAVDPDFAFTDTEIFGGWFNSGGSNFQGGADASRFNAEKGTWDVFLFQISVLGLVAADQSGEGNPLNGNATMDWFNGFLAGEITVFTQKPGGGAIPNTVEFHVPPSPSAGAGFLVAALLWSGRRRSGSCA